jgi:arsenite-transporting ATPase
MRLLIVGGKGGVGKTTCAAAVALAAARDNPDRRVLLVSTDPAPSIGDALGQPIGDAERRVRVGRDATLAVREIDAAAHWRAWRDRYRTRVEDVFARLGGPHSDLAVDRAIVEQLFELAPPGMDEIVGVLAIVDALTPRRAGARARRGQAAGRFDLVVVDSAPTGHTLRLLAMPGQAHAWVKQLMTVIVKYRLAGGVENLSTDLVWLSGGLMRLERLLVDARRCGFVAVTRAEQLVSLETARLVDWLQRHRIATRAVVVNGVTPPGCARCRRSAIRERRLIAAFTSRMARTRAVAPIVMTDATVPPPKGVAPLVTWARTWRVPTKSKSA